MLEIVLRFTCKPSPASTEIIYVGLTHDLEARIERHNKGYEKTTSPDSPFKLIYSEEVEDRQVARAREKYMKSGVGKEFLKSL